MNWNKFDFSQFYVSTWSSEPTELADGWIRRFVVVAQPPQGWVPMVVDMHPDPGDGWDGMFRFMQLGTPDRTRSAAQTTCEQWATSAWAERPAPGDTQPRELTADDVHAFLDENPDFVREYLGAEPPVPA